MNDERVVVYEYTDSHGTKHQVEDRGERFYDVALISENVKAETNNETVKELARLAQRVKELEDVAECATKFYKELEDSDVEIPIMAAFYWLGMRETLKKAGCLK